MSSYLVVAKKCINLLNYLFDLFIYFSHLLITRTGPLCVKRQEIMEIMKTVELEFKAYVELNAYIQIRTLCPRGLMRKSGLISGWIQGDTIYFYIPALRGSCESQDLFVEEKLSLIKSLRGMRNDGLV